MNTIRLKQTRAENNRLLWALVGHSGVQNCTICGKVFEDWRRKVRKQHGARREDLCKGFVKIVLSAKGVKQFLKLVDRKARPTKALIDLMNGQIR